jgi:stearoyl-CoA desaturase (delta-9 desaturase)
VCQRDWLHHPPTIGATGGARRSVRRSAAHHGLTRWQLDPGGWLIDGLERLGLAWDVVRITPDAQRAKLTSAPS